MILVHSKQKTPRRDRGLRAAHGIGKVPIALVPTAYPQMHRWPGCSGAGKIGLVIYGNHAIRAAVDRDRRTCSPDPRGRRHQSVDNEIVTVEEDFDLQGMAR